MKQDSVATRTPGAWLANGLWQMAAWRPARQFRQALQQPAVVQTRLLQKYLQANQATVYGRRFAFAAINSVEAYQAKVPLTTYDDYTALIERIGQGEPGVLTAEPVQMFEWSSGSTAASKLIPYTATLKAEFQRGLAPWITDLFAQAPPLKQGPAYWSITPLASGPQTTPAGMPIGFEEDSAYLGTLGKVVEKALAVPNCVKQITDIKTFRYVTLLFLLRQPNLRLISVWNPTFLTLLLTPLQEWWEPLLNDIAQGTLTPPGALAPEVQQALRQRLSPAPKRAKALATLQPTNYGALWPRLGLLSCWTDGAAAPAAQQLAQQFPGVRLQGKGLLATEAFVSLPLTGRQGGALAINAHFFEFLDEAQVPKLAHQLELGQVYQVVVTTGGGFYRYQLQDQVEVVDFAGQTPCVRFLGKTDRVSDQFGEKLSEAFVANALQKVLAAHHCQPTFVLVAPNADRTPLHYTLYLEGVARAKVGALAADLEQEFCTNFHYAYCRQLGQLGALRVVCVTNGAESYLRVCQSRGQKLGNIKPTVLDKQTGWARWFAVDGAGEL